jgi:hypothetical protein
LAEGSLSVETSACSSYPRTSPCDLPPRDVAAVYDPCKPGTRVGLFLSTVMYTVDGPTKRAVGFKLSDGMEVPTELASRFKFAKQKSKLAGTIRGSFLVIKGEY